MSQVDNGTNSGSTESINSSKYAVTFLSLASSATDEATLSSSILVSSTSDLNFFHGSRKAWFSNCSLHLDIVKVIYGSRIDFGLFDVGIYK